MPFKINGNWFGEFLVCVYMESFVLENGNLSGELLVNVLMESLRNSFQLQWKFVWRESLWNSFQNQWQLILRALVEFPSGILKEFLSKSMEIGLERSLVEFLSKSMEIGLGSSWSISQWNP